MNKTAAVLVALACACAPAHVMAENSVMVRDQRFVNHGLVAVGRLPADLRDRFGETFGSGSGMTLDPASWRRTADGYEGSIYLLPDRGYNVEGTTDYRARLNRLTLRITPVEPGRTPPAEQRQTGVRAELTETILLIDGNGVPMSGLDPERVSPAENGLPRLPMTKDGKVSLDPEAIVRMPDGSFFISDEYGPGIYRFSPEGRLLSSLFPPEALLPVRKGELNFSSSNPGPGAKRPDPVHPERGRQNNQGFEGMALTPDGGLLVTILQSATRQDGGDAPATRRHTRVFAYDVSSPAAPKLLREHVVPLPVFTGAKGEKLVAAQSELTALGNDMFLLLSRDSNNGHGLKGTTSLYRGIDLLDLRDATNIAGTEFDGSKPVAPRGELDPAVRPASLARFIDMNDNVELERFGLRNGPPNDRDNLSEKWEAMSLVSVMDPARPEDYFLLVANDNDFMTRKGHQVGTDYAAEEDVDTMFLVYRLTLPGQALRAQARH
ncbi:MAG: hypothetical protein JWL93_2973 [Hyphomicrobiales bacterium]|nr:hypothetical protein [Hyphomicrobiales bacterium]